MFDFVKMEQDILQKWKDLDLFRLIQESTKGHPTANRKLVVFSLLTILTSGRSNLYKNYQQTEINKL